MILVTILRMMALARIFDTQLMNITISTRAIVLRNEERPGPNPAFTNKFLNHMAGSFINGIFVS